MFGVGILIVFALLLASFILNVTSDIKDEVSNQLLQIYPDYYAKFTDPTILANELASDTER